MWWKIVAAGCGVIHRKMIFHVRRKWSPPSKLDFPIIASEGVGLIRATGNYFFPCHSNKYGHDALLWLKITVWICQRTAVVSGVLYSLIHWSSELLHIVFALPFLSSSLQCDLSLLTLPCESWPVPCELVSSLRAETVPCSLLHPSPHAWHGACLRVGAGWTFGDWMKTEWMIHPTHLVPFVIRFIHAWKHKAGIKESVFFS